METSAGRISDVYSTRLLLRLDWRLRQLGHNRGGVKGRSLRRYEASNAER